MSGDVSDLRCPFCNETDFDRIGLLRHLQVSGWCDEIPKIENEMMDEVLRRALDREDR